MTWRYWDLGAAVMLARWQPIHRLYEVRDTGWPHTSQEALGFGVLGDRFAW